MLVFIGTCLVTTPPVDCIVLYWRIVLEEERKRARLYCCEHKTVTKRAIYSIKTNVLRRYGLAIPSRKPAQDRKCVNLLPEYMKLTLQNTNVHEKYEKNLL